jgi:hypothetical protein
MRRAGDTNFLCHRTFPAASFELSAPAARCDGDALFRKVMGWANGTTLIVLVNPAGQCGCPWKAVTRDGTGRLLAERALTNGNPIGETCGRRCRSLLPAGPFDLDSTSRGDWRRGPGFQIRLRQCLPTNVRAIGLPVSRCSCTQSCRARSIGTRRPNTVKNCLLLPGT